MSLLDRASKERPGVGDKGSNRRIEKNLTKTVSAKDRKTLKVDPECKDKIEIIKNILGSKEYEIANEMVDFFISNNMDERQQRIIKRMLDAKSDI